MNAKQPGMPETTQTVKINVNRYFPILMMMNLNRNVMKTTAFNNTIIKISGLHIGTESRHRYKGVKLFFIDLFGRNVITLKYY